MLDTQDGGGWSIATVDSALGFTNALLAGTSLAGTSSCTHSGTSVTEISCGTVSPWTVGDLGFNHSGGNDVAWFLDHAGDADYVDILSSGDVYIYDFGTLAGSDAYAAPVSWLLVRPTVVPVPAAVWLFGSGLIGLIGVARRKKA